MIKMKENRKERNTNVLMDLVSFAGPGLGDHFMSQLRIQIKATSTVRRYLTGSIIVRI